MILNVTADFPGFRASSTQFRKGLNLVVADRDKNSTAKDSRNGVGKSSLLAIIDFCLGGKPNKTLSFNQLSGVMFSLDIVLRGKRYRVQRKTGDDDRVHLEGDFSLWPLQPTADLFGQYMEIEHWKRVLGYLLFGLGLDLDEDYNPTFRGLMNRWLRQGKRAYVGPFEASYNQKVWQKQVFSSYFLDMGWEFARERVLLDDLKNEIKEIEKASQSDLISDLSRTKGELEADRVVTRDNLDSHRRSLCEFKVHPQYKELERELDELSKELHDLEKTSTKTVSLVRHYRDSIREEAPADIDAIESVYRESGVVFPEQIVKRLEDVQSFHQQVIRNRSDFLKGEIRKLEREKRDRQKKIEKLSNERGKLMKVLEGHGALEEFTLLQEQLINSEQKLRAIEQRIEAMDRIEQVKQKQKLDMEELEQKIKRDHEQRLPSRERAIAQFNRNSEALYQKPGSLIIDNEKNRFRFAVEIDRSESDGIQQMEVFCFDLMLAQLWADRQDRPDFLIHDSLIFDGVDERQVALALKWAADQSEKRGFQYICCLNSDNIPHDELGDFDLDQYVRLRLDDTEHGGLFGRRFPSSKTSGSRM